MTSMSILLIVGPKCTLAASHAARLVGEYADGTDRDRQTNSRPLQYSTLSARRGERNNYIAVLPHGEIF